MTQRNINLLLALLALLLVSPASAQTWTGAEVLNSGDWVEMSYAGGQNGSRAYEVVGSSLRWVAGNGVECAGVSPYLGRCIGDRTFRLPLPSTCIELISVSYHYTNEGSPGLNTDNDFYVEIGSATRTLRVETGDTFDGYKIARVEYDNLNDPVQRGGLLFASASSNNPVGTEIWVDAAYDLTAGSTWDVTMEVSTSLQPSLPTLSATSNVVPSAGEQLYLFLTSGDRSEQYLLHSVTLEGCAVPDTDGDGVDDDVDVCDDTAIPEDVPTKHLGVNRFALTTVDSSTFDTTPPPGGGNGPGLSFTTADTAGCSCRQIIDALELGSGHEKFGCSISAMEAWIALVSP